MCTLTWAQTSGGYTLFFNRDEQRTRQPAAPPSVHHIHDGQFLSPVDPHAGGSWLTVNQHGFTVAILNFYDADVARLDGVSKHRSRGLLVLDLATIASFDAVQTHLTHRVLDLYRPFILLVFDACGQGREFRWNGKQLAMKPVTGDDLPITTSSYRTPDVLACRKKRFEQMRDQYGGIDAAWLASYHKSKDEQGGAYSVTMTRSDAMTVSFSSVVVGIDTVSFYYEPRPEGVGDPEYDQGVSVAIKRT